MKTIAITASQEGTGKTAVTIGLGILAEDRDLTVGYMKPKGTRLESHVGKVLDRDPLLAQELLDIDADVSEMEPIVYSPTFIENAVRGQEDPKALREQVIEAFESLAHGTDVFLIEGAGHLDLGGIVELTDPDIATLIGADVTLVSDFEHLGDLDRILHATRDFGDALSGILFNRVRDRGVELLERDAIPYLERQGHAVHGIVEYDRELAGVTVREFAEDLGARRLVDVGADAFVERFIVGAMSGDQALRQFRRLRNTAVITGGDRSEIHTAAIEASGITCLVVTGGIRPSSTILGRARGGGLAVLAVDADTLGTVERAEEIVRGGRTRDAETVRRMADYLEEHVNVDEMLAVD